MARLITWAHMNTPYYPTYDSALPGNPQDVRRLTTGNSVALHSLPRQSLPATTVVIKPLVSFDRPEKGFKQFNQRAKTPGGFYLPNAVKQRQFNTASGKAEITVNPLNPIRLEGDQLLLQTFRSHDQFNTTIYGNNDRYRGIKNERRVLFMNTEDMQARGLVAEQPVDITSHFEGETRTADLFLVIPYDTPQGCAAAYYPEANVLVPIASQAAHSGTPTSKSVVVTVCPHRSAGTPDQRH